MVNWPLVGHKITLPPTVQHVLYVTLTTLCPPRLFPASSPVNRTNIGRPPLVWFSRLIPWAHGRRGGGSAELRLQGWGGGFCGNRARPAEKNPCNGPVLRYHGVRRPAAPRVFSLPLLWLGLVLGGGLPCPRVTGSYRPSGWDTDWPYWFARQGQPSPDLSRASDFRLYSMVVEAAVEGMGTAIGHSRVMARDMERGDLVPLFDRQVEAPVRSCLITTAGSRRNPGVQAFREWILIEA